MHCIPRAKLPVSLANRATSKKSRTCCYSSMDVDRGRNRVLRGEVGWGKRTERFDTLAIDKTA